MARIAGVDIPNDKRVVIALTYIYGIGKPSAIKICSVCSIDIDTRVKDLSDAETSRLRDQITTEFKVEGALRTEIQMNIKRLMDIGCYRGLRHRRGLPVRGQRTKTNSRTKRGRKKSVGAKRKR